jgi:sensor histidine kinase YesM
VTSQEIPLSLELSLLDRYIEIQQARFGERLRIEKHIDSAALEMPVPALVLQPLIENAIRHGIEPKTSAGLVVLTARREPAALILSVRDNGAGMKQASQGNTDGIGLTNTRARLQELYGDRARLSLNSPAEGGCEVELEIRVKP